MAKLDASRAKWIARQRRSGTPVAKAAEAMKISARRVTELACRCGGCAIDDIVFPQPMGRPAGGMPGRLEESAAVSAYWACVEGSTMLADRIENATGLRMPHRAMHGRLKAHDPARIDPRKSGQRRTARCVKRYANTMWRVDCKLLPGGRWLLSYMDDALRLVVGHGMLEKAAAANAPAVMDAAVAKYGAPLSVLSGRGSVFCAAESEKRIKGKSEYEKSPEARGMRHIVARVRHPQTNGKIERMHGGPERKLYAFAIASASVTTRSVGGLPSHAGSPFHTAPAADPVDRFFHWYNFERPHMALDRSRHETPIQAFRRLLPKDGDNVLEDMESSGAYE